MITGATLQQVRDLAVPHPVLRSGPAPYLFSAALGVIAAVAAALSLAFPGLLRGVPIANGNMRGTAAVVLAVGVPLLALSMTGTARGSARAFVVWLGTLGYLLYQAVLFCFATPVNDLFLVYVAYLGLAVWSIVITLRATDLKAFGACLSPRIPATAVCGFAIVVVALNAVAWLRAIVPALIADDPGRLVTGSGLLTNPVHIQDLAVWLPLLAVAAPAGWRHETWGLLVTAGMLVMFVLESISIAIDQWFGSRAAPGSPIASMSMVPTFALVALVTAIPLIGFLRGVDPLPRIQKSVAGL